MISKFLRVRKLRDRMVYGIWALEILSLLVGVVVLSFLNLLFGKDINLTNNFVIVLVFDYTLYRAREFINKDKKRVLIKCP